MLNKCPICGEKAMKKDGEKYINGSTHLYNYFTVNHNLYQSDNPAIQKVKTRESS